VENPDSGVGREEFTIEQAKPSLPAEVDVDRIASLELEKQLAHLKSEQASLQKVAEALAADVKRLMKERREPLTDADLKESLNEANLRLKRLQEQNKKLIEQISQKDSQIELLKAQVERLKSNAA
jgi:chromosome segregation ATPase